MAARRLAAAMAGRCVCRPRGPSRRSVVSRRLAPKILVRPSGARTRRLSSSAPQDDGDGGSSTHFGFRTVPRHHKQELVKGVFHSVASNYDRMNDFMSAGVHRLWKEHLVNTMDPRPGMKVLDVAGGTGDVAFRILRSIVSKSAPRLPRTSRADEEQRSEVCVLDINESMLAVGEERAKDTYGFDQTYLDSHGMKLDFVEGNAESLPFDDNTFDVYSIAFGLRNVTTPENALVEAHRVLRPGGRFLCLEFSHIPYPGVSSAYDWYSFNVIPVLGQLVAEDRASYEYLVESIRKFPSQAELLGKMEDAGFLQTSYENLSLGVVAMHSGFKLP